jgi:type I restriction enzyme S subunit
VHQKPTERRENGPGPNTSRTSTQMPNQIKELTIPFPPMNEQNRIVKKLEELMQHCNELEASIKESGLQNEKILQQVLREALRMPEPQIL